MNAGKSSLLSSLQRAQKGAKTAVFANPLELKGKRLKVKISTQKPDKISVFKYRYLPLKCGVFR
jgi:hypothetical protein